MSRLRWREAIARVEGKITIHVRMDVKLYGLLRALAAHENRTIPWIVRSVLQRTYAKELGAFELPEDLRLGEPDEPR
jgi:hypothetical protein